IQLLRGPMGHRGLLVAGVDERKVLLTIVIEAERRPRAVVPGCCGRGLVNLHASPWCLSPDRLALEPAPQGAGAMVRLSPSIAVRSFSITSWIRRSMPSARR